MQAPRSLAGIGSAKTPTVAIFLLRTIPSHDSPSTVAQLLDAVPTGAAPAKLPPSPVFRASNLFRFADLQIPPGHRKGPRVSDAMNLQANKPTRMTLKGFLVDEIRDLLSIHPDLDP